MFTVQALMFKSDVVSKQMIKFTKGIANESIIEIVGKVQKAPQEIQSCSQKDAEVCITEIWVIHPSLPRLPFTLEDGGRRVENQESEWDPLGEEEKKEEPVDEEGKKKDIIIGQNTRLNNRIIDLRIPANQAIMRVRGQIAAVYREFCSKQGWIEINSPKIIGGSSEGGAEVFKLDYFGRSACLAQSPQLYKQMCIASDFPGVFEIGPVFRAENSNTPRHLCEFTGLDYEVPFKNHYFEVVDIIGDMFRYIFANLPSRCEKELEIIQDQYPFEPFLMNEGPTVTMSFQEGIELLKEAGVEQNPLKDLGAEAEKALGKIVREKHKTDFFVLYNYPKEARPFYSMINPHDDNFTNSYDVFMRGEEIMSGAQRIHDPAMLAERATACGIDVDTIKDYIESFQYGCPPHAGGGIGLERVCKLFLGLHNIRKVSLFPRDPKTLTP